MEYYGEIKILSHDNMDESNKQNQKEKKKARQKRAYTNGIAVSTL